MDDREALLLQPVRGGALQGERQLRVLEHRGKGQFVCQRRKKEAIGLVGVPKKKERNNGLFAKEGAASGPGTEEQSH